MPAYRHGSRDRVVALACTLTACAAVTVGGFGPHRASGAHSLLDAVAAGNVELVRSILARGASPDTSDESGRTALMIAVDRGHHQVAILLLDLGATVNAQTPQGEMALAAATAGGHTELARLLRERGAGAEPPVSLDALTPPVAALTPTSASAGAPGGRTSRQALVSVQLEPVLGNLTSPLYVTHARDGSNRLFVVEQPGRIKVLQTQTSTATVFLDITAKVLAGGEQGLLGLAFHPDYAFNRRFFVNYTRQPDGATVIAEYHASLANPDVSDVTETVLLVIPQPFANHNGGMVEFGPDGFLYIGMGDGGSGNDPGNRAQDITDLLGKILRIDVDTPNPPAPYSSPADNPFNGAPAGRAEIYALGFRNPFRFSFDRETGALVVGDVGQNAREEIDVVIRGGNYGWRVFEGFLCTGIDPAACGAGGFIPPVADYDHTGRCSITGGYVYRGTRDTFPVGTYVYGDFCSGEILQLFPVANNGAQAVVLDTALSLASFGEDEAGEILVVALDGAVFRLVASPLPPGGADPGPPATSPSDDGGSSGGGVFSCFIATAAFGSPLAPEVQTLRDFRDCYLLTNTPGRVFVAAYYRISPSVAALIGRHAVLRALARQALRPAIWGARAVETSPGGVVGDGLRGGGNGRAPTLFPSRASARPGTLVVRGGSTPAGVPTTNDETEARVISIATVARLAVNLLLGWMFYRWLWKPGAEQLSAPHRHLQLVPVRTGSRLSPRR
jgi:glucose/arabinose dehydrogenase